MEELRNGAAREAPQNTLGEVASPSVLGGTLYEDTLLQIVTSNHPALFPSHPHTLLALAWTTLSLVWELSIPESLEGSPHSPAVGSLNVLTYNDLCKHKFAFLHLHILEKIEATVPSLSNALQQDFCVVLDVGFKSMVEPG
eukprot:3239768-Rhodomonas_salina.1